MFIWHVACSYSCETLKLGLPYHEYHIMRGVERTEDVGHLDEA